MKQFKQLMKIGSRSFTERVADNFLQAGVSELVIVTGSNADLLEKQLSDLPVRFVRNPDYDKTEMFDSVKLGLRAMEGKADRVFFCPADVPLFTMDTIRAEMAADGDIIIPVCNGKDGHPLLADAGLIPGILAYEGEGGLKGAYKSLPDITVKRIEVFDEGAVTDADTKEEYEKLIELHEKRESGNEEK
jgi:CTP:molybdopterin cytidylyltransferase MocA